MPQIDNPVALCCRIYMVYEWTKYEPTSKVFEFFHEKIKIFDEIFYFNSCDQKLLVLTIYGKPYLSWCLVPPLLPPPFAVSPSFGVNPPVPPVSPDVAAVFDDVPPVPAPVPPPLAALDDEPALLCELPLSRFWFRSFSSRLHLALRLENQTWNEDFF